MRWYRPLQLSRNDPTLDVPHGSHMWQHIHNEGTKGHNNAMIPCVFNWQPSERDPTACMALVELLKEAGGEKYKF